ncbi:MAG: signal recognition particle subunit SRP19/SEC65 family protein [Thermoplasmatota archaeon]
MRDRYVLWPLYFDRGVSRQQGRRVPRDMAVKNPSVDDVAAAARKLQLDPEVDADAAHPSRWWQREGRVLVEQQGSKTGIVRDVAAELNKKQ